MTSVFGYGPRTENVSFVKKAITWIAGLHTWVTAVVSCLIARKGWRFPTEEICGCKQNVASSCHQIESLKIWEFPRSWRWDEVAVKRDGFWKILVERQSGRWRGLLLNCSFCHRWMLSIYCRRNSSRSMWPVWLVLYRTTTACRYWILYISVCWAFLHSHTKGTVGRSRGYLIGRAKEDVH